MKIYILVAFICIAILLINHSANGLLCYCDICTSNNTCKTDGLCLAAVNRQSNGLISHSFRCLNKDVMIPPPRPVICLESQHNRHREVVHCCNDRDMCNQYTIPTLAPLPLLDVADESQQIKWKIGEVAFISAVVVILIAIVIGGVTFFVRRGKVFRTRHSYLTDIEAHKHSEKLLSSMPETTTSTSGSGLPLLQQRTIARQLRLAGKVGAGRYGEVHRAHYQSDFVAVKIFLSSDEASFRRETEIYQTCMLRHENVLGFIASDNIDVNNVQMQMWLITDYHEKGSLFDFLNREPVDRKLMIRLCLSAVTGLAHLHQDIVGDICKVAIAHRDIKSKNILVKNNLTCCIADLGLAVKHNLDTDSLDVPENRQRTGTVRYMAPEVLDATINTRHFDSFKRADVYSMGLVLWEVTKCCSLNGIAENYQMPFDGMVANNPSVDEMRQLVSVDNKRPPMPSRWQGDETMKTMSRLMRECWAAQPSARLTILRVKKTLVGLASKEDVKI